jgi:hypothetical protein
MVRIHACSLLPQQLAGGTTPSDIKDRAPRGFGSPTFCGSAQKAVPPKKLLKQLRDP